MDDARSIGFDPLAQPACSNPIAPTHPHPGPRSAERLAIDLIAHRARSEITRSHRGTEIGRRGVFSRSRRGGLVGPSVLLAQNVGNRVSDPTGQLTRRGRRPSNRKDLRRGDEVSLSPLASPVGWTAAAARGPAGRVGELNVRGLRSKRRVRRGRQRSIEAGRLRPIFVPRWLRVISDLVGCPRARCQHRHAGRSQSTARSLSATSAIAASLAYFVRGQKKPFRPSPFFRGTT